MRAYLAGPMTGYPQFNFPKFKDYTARLRDLGWEIVSPVELDDGPVADHAMKSKDGALDEKGEVVGNTWGDLLSRDVKVISDLCNSIIMMEGWEKSKGARLELFVALSCGYPVFLVEDTQEGGMFIGPADSSAMTATLLKEMLLHLERLAA